MKRIISFLCFIILINSIAFSVFSFTIDGNDTGIEWDGATVYKLLDGESNCGVNFGVVKIKFDYDTDSICFCFLFLEPGLTPDNQLTGISFAVDDSPFFELVAADGYRTYNINPYCFEGAIYLDDNNGVTCEVRVGIKSGLPENFDGSVRFIDSNGFYSNYYRFTVVNESYEPEEEQVIRPTADNTDPAYNTGASISDKTTKKKSTKLTTRKRNTIITTREPVIIKTSPPYSYTGRTKITKPITAKETTANTTKTKDSQSRAVSVFYYEKEIYISKVYVTQSDSPTTAGVSKSAEMSSDIIGNLESLSAVTDKTNFTGEHIPLSKGTKLKKIVSVAGFIAFFTIAFCGTYSARKNGKSFQINKTDEKH